MQILTANAIEGFKQYIERTVYRARYKIGGTYYDVPIHRKERLKDGRVALYFSLVPGIGEKFTISEVQLFDMNNDVWASKAENIELTRLQQGVLYRFAFDFKEV